MIRVRLAAALCLTALALSACGTTGAGPLAAHRSGLSAVRSDAAPSLPAATFAASDTEAYYDMATFEAMEQILLGAKRSIRLDYYIFGGPTANRLADILVAKHKAGVSVKVILDAALGTIPEIKNQTRPVYEKLKAAGIPLAFHDTTPIAPATKGERIDHNKYFVVDDQALLGSMNLAKKFYGFHDVMVRIEGAPAKQLEAQFDFDWYYATHPKAPRPDVLVHAAPARFAPPAASAQSMVRVVGTGTGRKTGREALMPLLAGAKKSIYIQMHELSDMRVMDALEAARDRGVDVRLILDPGNIDAFVPIIHKGPRGIVNAIAVDRLLKSQMNVRHFRTDADTTTAHMKTAVIDGEILYVGSINWTEGGFEWVSETNLEIHGGKAPAQAAARFAADWVERSIPAEPPSAAALALCKLYNKR